MIERMIETRHAITFNSLSHSNLEWKRFFQFLFLLIMSVLWFISAFRDEHIGSDHGNYVDAFHNIEKNGDAYFTEKGYVLLNKIAIIIGGGTVTLTILVTTLILLNFIIYIRKYVSPDYYIFSILVFVFQPYLYIQCSFNIMRQGCAIAIVLLSIPFLLQGKWVEYIFTILIASTFHSSVLVMLLLILFRKIDFTPTLIRRLAIICLIMNLLNVGTLVFKIISRYSLYETYDASLLNFRPYVFAITFIVLYFTSIYSELYKSKEEKVLVDLFILSLVFLIFAVQNDMLYRVYIVLAFISIPGITIICKNLKGKRNYIELCFVGYYSLFYIFYVSLWYINNDTAYMPFKFIFE